MHRKQAATILLESSIKSRYPLMMCNRRDFCQHHHAAVSIYFSLATPDGHTCSVIKIRVNNRCRLTH